jgi:hypothetical protein
VATTKLQLCLAMFLLAGCASGPAALEKLAGAQISTIPVASDAEATHVIQNKVRWLGFLFEQSRDPYYGTEKWPAACLAANRIGALRAIPGGTISLSRLLMDQRRRPGLCPTAVATEHVLLYLHCEGQTAVRELTAPASSWNFGEGDQLCR